MNKRKEKAIKNYRYVGDVSEGNDAWLMKIELKREEPREINKDDGIKKATGDQVPAVVEEDILQLDHTILTPTEIEPFKMIELARI